jgi:rhodanese-related sulfurtransferase
MLVLIAGAPCVSADAVVPGSQNVPPEGGKSKCLSAGYCGIYCLYAAMKYFDVEVEPNDLLKPEYIGSNEGSSLAELKKAAQDHGLFAEPVAKLTTKELRHSLYPIILHVKSSPAKKVYDHYELFLRNKDGRVCVYDPPQPVRAAPFYELAPRWDGTGLIVSNRPIDLGAVFAPARWRFMVWAAIALAAVLVVRWGRSRLLPPARFLPLRGRLTVSVIEGVAVTAVAILAAFAYHLINEEGFLARGEATSDIQQAYQGSFVPKIGEREVRRLLALAPYGAGLTAGNKAVFVDARSPLDFQTGHLQGAVNIPENAPDEQRRAATANIDKNARIIVYCRSASCGFAQAVAVKLLDDGFTNVSVCLVSAKALMRPQK